MIFMSWISFLEKKQKIFPLKRSLNISGIFELLKKSFFLGLFSFIHFFADKKTEPKNQSQEIL